MEWKNTLAIHLGFWLYLLIGGVIFYFIEYSVYYPVSANAEHKNNDTFCENLVNLVETYLSSGANQVMENEGIWLAVVKESCKNLTREDKNPLESGAVNSVWEYSSALFLCMTILTTIGYGNFSPKTDGGKIFCIIYGLVGIPICGIFLATTSDYFSNKCLRLFERQKKRKHDKWHSILIAAFFFLLPGLAVFLFVPAAIFTVLEGWTYLDAVYFSFVTLTTVGFGDIVAAQQPNSTLLWFYRICVIIWVTLGIAYWAIIIAFIMKAFKSKELSQRWEKTSHAITEQAKEMRRAMEQLSIINAEHHEPFVAPKTKAAFDFALKMAGNIGHMGPTIEDKSLPGIATAFQPQGSNHGLLGMMELPIIGGQHRQHKVNPPTTTPPEEQIIETSPQNPIRPSLEKMRDNIHSISTDSGFDDVTVDNTAGMTPHSTESPANSNQPTVLPSADSGVPLTFEPMGKDGKDKSKWKMLARSITLPELHHRHTKTPAITPSPTKNPQLSELFLEAMLILNEAEVRGASLNTKLA